MIGFGAAVLDAEREEFRFGSVSRAALTVAEIPQSAKRMLRSESAIRVWASERVQVQANRMELSVRSDERA